MPHRNWKFRIQDILEAITAIMEYTQEMAFSNFTADRKTVDAVVRNLIIIGEAAIQIPDDICLQYPDIPWYEIRGMRNFVVHEYFRTSDKIIWDTIHEDLLPLKKLLERIIQ